MVPDFPRAGLWVQPAACRVSLPRAEPRTVRRDAGSCAAWTGRGGAGRDRPSVRSCRGTAPLADIARELVSVMRRDMRTDWTVRDDVRAKLRSSIKRLLIKHRYPPDKQPGAIKLVLEQMESMAPRYAADRA
ncbi:MAG TPA: type I restriction enzyme endonuclease domain-containing protein [Pseudonocardiaceae bacterium]